MLKPYNGELPTWGFRKRIVNQFLESCASVMEYEVEKGESVETAYRGFYDVSPLVKVMKRDGRIFLVRVEGEAND